MSDSNKTFVGYDVQGGYLQKWRNGITQYYELEKISMNEAGKIQKVFADCRLLFSANTIHYLVVYVTNSYNSEFRSIFLEVVKKHNNIKKVWIIGPEAIFCCAAIAEMKKNEELFTNDIWCIIASQTSVCCNMFELVKDKTNKLWRLRCSKVLKRTSAANESVSIKELESLKNEIICSGHPYIYAHGINTSILEYVFPNGKQIDNKHISVDMFARYAVLLGMGKFDFGYSHFKCSSCSGRPLKIELGKKVISYPEQHVPFNMDEEDVQGLDFVKIYENNVLMAQVPVKNKEKLKVEVDKHGIVNAKVNGKNVKLW